MLKTSSSATVAITGSVGFGGQNREADVKTIQVLLNAKLPIPLQRLPENGVCDGQTIFAISTYQTRNLGSPSPDGRVDVGGATFRSLAGKKAATPPAAASDGKKYTENPNERVTTRTTPAYADVVAMLLVAWPDLNQNGARTLTAQFVHETGSGKYCFNWNLGNEKSGANIPHMYLKNVWECVSLAGSVAMVDKAGGQARVATGDEIARHKWSCTDTVVVFSPPHPQCRFKAYDSLQDGAQKWMGHHKKIATANPAFLTALNAGDTAAAAHALKTESPN